MEMTMPEALGGDVATPSDTDPTQPGTQPEGQQSESAQQGDTDAPRSEQEQQPDTPEKKESRNKRRLDHWKGQAAYWKGVAEARQSEPSKPQQASPDTGKEPKREDYESYEQFVEERAAWRAEKAVDSRLKSHAETQTRNQQQREQARLQESLIEKVEKAHDKYDDFDEVINESEAVSTPTMSHAIAESDATADLMYFLAKHPEEAARIAKLSPVRQIAEIGKLEDKVQQKAPPPKASSAPEPIKPVGGKSGTVEKDPNKMTDAEFDKWFDEKRGRRRR